VWKTSGVFRGGIGALGVSVGGRAGVGGFRVLGAGVCWIIFCVCFSSVSGGGEVGRGSKRETPMGGVITKPGGERQLSVEHTTRRSRGQELLRRPGFFSWWV
jgi:hypothetical protein